MESKLTEKFINGLKKKHNVSFDEITSDWKYCGGLCGSHLNYFKIAAPKNVTVPEPTDHCVCGHAIKENCFITNGDTMIPLGNCCIKRFIPQSTRTCESCNQSHKNRKDNLCMSCRYKKDHPKQYANTFDGNVEIKVSYHDRQLVKDLGCMWNVEDKYWFMPRTISKENVRKLIELKEKGIVDWVKVHKWYDC